MTSGSVRRERLKQAGLCSQCTNLRVEGRSRCQSHLDKAKELGRQRNAERKRFGLCIRCPKKASEGHVLCEACLGILRSRETNQGDKRDKELSKQRLRRAAGLCKWCEKPNAPGRILCEDHLATERDKVRIYRADRKARGLCWRCPNPVRPGGVLCQQHRDEVTARERKPSGLGASISVTGKVPAKVDPAPVLRGDGGDVGKESGREPVVPVQNDGLGINSPPVATVVDQDGVDRTSSQQLFVEEPDSSDVPGFRHDPGVIISVQAHRSVASSTCRTC